MGLYDYFFAKGEQERSDRLDAQRIALNKKAHEENPEKFNDAWLTRTQENDLASHIDANQEISDGFHEGWNDGYKNVTGGIKGIINAPFNFALDSLPWWIWLALAGAIFVWMGGLSLLKGRLAKS